MVMVKDFDSDRLKPLSTLASPLVVLDGKVRTNDSPDRSLVRNP